METDLFGDPIRLPNGKRGRPAHQPTQKNRNKVMMLQAMGWSNERIANALRVSQPTLRRYYFSELKLREMQRDRFDAWRLEVVVEKVQAGDIGAVRELNKMVEKNDMMRRAVAFPDKDDEPEPPEPAGKKEKARLAALERVEGGSEGDWDDDLTPGRWN